MKKLIVLIAFFFPSFLLKAQEEYKDLIYRATNADYIFEGVVIKNNPYKTTDDRRIYTSNTIQITKSAEREFAMWNC